MQYRTGDTSRDISILDDLGAEITGIITPVSICMAVTVFLVRLLNPDGAAQPSSTVVIASIAYSEKDGDSIYEKLGGSFLNALVFVGIITCVTFLLVLLFKYRCYRVIYCYLGFGVFNVFFALTGALLIQLLQLADVHMDAISFCFLLFNFSVIGTTGLLFVPLPLSLKQSYLVWTGIITAFMFTRIPEWTTWMLLGAMALYDIVAVLVPGGPLRLLVEMMVERQEDIPGALIYEARPTGRPYQPGRWTDRSAAATATATDTSAPQAVTQGAGADVEPTQDPRVLAAQFSGTSVSRGGSLRERQGQSLQAQPHPVEMHMTRSAMAQGQGASYTHVQSTDLPSAASHWTGPGPISEGTELDRNRTLYVPLPLGPQDSDLGLLNTSGQATASPRSDTSAASVLVKSGSASTTTQPNRPDPVLVHPLTNTSSRGNSPNPTTLTHNNATLTPTSRPTKTTAQQRHIQQTQQHQQRHTQEPQQQPQQQQPQQPQQQQLQLNSESETSLLLPLGHGAVADPPTRSAARQHQGGGPGGGPEYVRLGMQEENPGAVEAGTNGEAAEDADDSMLPDSIKLGLGDFIFYSLLVGRAAMYDVMTVFAAYLAIMAGLGLTLVCLAVFQKALPALPFSVALGVMFYFLCRLVLEPFLVPLATHYTYF